MAQVVMQDHNLRQPQRRRSTVAEMMGAQVPVKGAEA